MLNWLLNKFRKCPYELPSEAELEPETETYEVGEIDLIFSFKDETMDIRSFVGHVYVDTEFGIEFDFKIHKVKSALSKALDFLELSKDFGWYMKDENTLVPMSDITEINIARRPHSVTVKKL